MNDSRNEELCNRRYPVDEDMHLQRRVWRFERVGWYLLLLLIGLTLAGLFSKGPLSSRQVAAPDGKLQVHYQRFLRNGSTDALVIRLQGQPRTALEVAVSGELLQGFSVEMLQPQPVKASAEQEGVRLWVLSDAGGRAVLHLTLRSDGVGSFVTRVSMATGPALVLSQFIYP